MTKDPELAAAFKAALKYLSPTIDDDAGPEPGKHVYICDTLNEAAKKREITWFAMWRAQRVVMDRMVRHFNFQDWLCREIGRCAVNADIKYNQGRKLQGTRRRWVLSLVKEFS